jgi:xyloglucan galactosyltransferase MUR3
MVWLHNSRYAWERFRYLHLAYPSCVHLRASDEPPWQASAANRSVLISFGASMNGSPSANKLRVKLREKCISYGPSLCELVSTHNMMGEAGVLDRAYSAKRRATFCLEPPGFGPERKSMADALTLGCIPVLFEPDEEPYLWPYQWNSSWKAKSRVLLDGEQVLSGRVDVLQALRAIPNEQVARMQAAIAANVHAMHYGYDDIPGDAFDLALRAIVQEVAWTSPTPGWW